MFGKQCWVNIVRFQNIYLESTKIMRLMFAWKKVSPRLSVLARRRAIVEACPPSQRKAASGFQIMIGRQCWSNRKALWKNKQIKETIEKLIRNRFLFVYFRFHFKKKNHFTSTQKDRTKVGGLRKSSLRQEDRSAYDACRKAPDCKLLSPIGVCEKNIPMNCVKAFRKSIPPRAIHKSIP